ncbi:UNVERIFIED_CONTAM: hypothetical protein ABIC26_003829 [Paenibacillus sp. PvR008]
MIEMLFKKDTKKGVSKAVRLRDSLFVGLIKWIFTKYQHLLLL